MIIKKQEGFVLVTSMIFAAVLALIAISAMKGVTLETKIVNMHQNKETTHQLAQSAIDQAFNRSDNFLDATISAPVTISQTGISAPTATVRVVANDLNVSGGFDADVLVATAYEIDGVATTVDNKVVTQIVQGVTKIHRKSN